MKPESEATQILGGIDYGMAAVQVLVFAFAISVHESSHAAVADHFGDQTARRLGRISLNPLVHVDLIGTVLLPLLLISRGLPVFGWAKPVPVNPLNLRNPKIHSMWVAAAGPISNLTLAVISAVLYHGLMMIFPSIPDSIGVPVHHLILSSCIVNAYLAIFNLIPIFPLDGSSVLAGLLPDDLSAKYMQFQRYGMLLLIPLLYIGADRVIAPVAGALFRLLGIRFS